MVELQESIMLNEWRFVFATLGLLMRYKGKS